MIKSIKRFCYYSYWWFIRFYHFNCQWWNLLFANSV